MVWVRVPDSSDIHDKPCPGTRTPQTYTTNGVSPGPTVGITAETVSPRVPQWESLQKWVPDWPIRKNQGEVKKMEKMVENVEKVVESGENHEK